MVNEEKQLRGLGGWLGFLGLGLVVAPLRMLIVLSRDYAPILEPGFLEALTREDSVTYSPWWRPVLISEVSVNTVLFVASLYMIYLFFTKHTWFPRVFVTISLFTLVFVILSACAAALVLADEPMFDAATLKEVLGSLVQCSIWVPYVLISKRVEATFTETRRHPALLTVGGALIVSGIVGAFVAMSPRITPWSAMSLEERLEALELCGVALAPGRTTDELLMSHDRSEYEADELLLLDMLGRTVASEPNGLRFSDDVWYFDFERIESEGSYVSIAEEIGALAGMGLPLENIQDHVDLEEGVAWLEFELDGLQVHWDAQVDGDWVDPEILSKFAQLLINRGELRLTHLDLRGQGSLLGVGTESQVICLLGKTGLDFVWLE